jgi:hypothetical protein
MRVAMGDFVCENNTALSDKRLSELCWRWERLVCRMMTDVRVTLLLAMSLQVPISSEKGHCYSELI